MIISAVISTYNRERYLPQVLESLAKQTFAKSDFEIIIINNNSTDTTEAISRGFIASHPELNCRYIIETRQGLSFGRNRGISESTGKYITFIDDDAFLAHDYLQKVVDAFIEYPDIVAVGSKILLHYEDIVPAWENKYLNSLLGWFDPGDEAFDFTSKNYPRGSNMSFTSEVFEKVGLFNTDLGRVGRNLAGSEEKDIFQRIYAKNYKVKYIPDALVYHCVPFERTTTSFIRRQGIGTGQSEKRRVQAAGSIHFLKRIGSELIKWMASFVLFFSYLIRGKFAKGWMIVRFRFWVSKGLLAKSRTSA